MTKRKPNMKTKRHAPSKKVVLSIQEETINCMVEVARLFPNQDPIRLAAGYNAIAEKVASERKEIIAKKVVKQIKGNL